MALSFQRYLDYMDHAIGRVPADGHRLADTLNDAGRQVFNAGQVDPWNHRWSWLVKDNVQLLIPAQSDFAPLPDDFGSIIDAQEEERVVGAVILTDMHQILTLRSDITVSPVTVWLAFDAGITQASKTSRPQKIVAVYPQQDTPKIDVRMTYVRTWAELEIDDETGELKDPTAVPDMPGDWELMLKYACMRLASQIENEDASAYQGMYEDELKRLVKYDSNRQSNYGPQAHSVMSSARNSTGFNYPHKRIGRSP